MGLKEALRCGWCDKVFGKCGVDPDEAFAFSTPKIVKINDRTLGCFSLVCTLAIFWYIIWDLVANQGYLIILPPTGTVKLSARLPPFLELGAQPHCWGSNQATTGPERCCTDCRRPYPYPLVDVPTPYCSKDPATGNPSNQPGHGYDKGIIHPCMYWDNKQYVLPLLGSQTLLTTRVKQSQVSLPCYRDLDTSSGVLWAQSLECIRQHRDRGDPYPPSDQETFRGFVAAADNVTISFDHTMSIRHPKVKLSRRVTEMKGFLKYTGRCGSGKVRQMEKWNPSRNSAQIDLVENRLFTLNELLSVAEGGQDESERCKVSLDEPSLVEVSGDNLVKCRTRVKQQSDGTLAPFSPELRECGATIRYDGLVLLVTIEYDNLRDDGGELDDPQYSITVEAFDRSQASVEQSMGFAGTVDYQGRHGVLVMVQQVGQIGAFDFKTLLINLTAGLGLLAVANTVTIFAAKTICPKIVGHNKYYELLVQESPDFNEEGESFHQVKAKRAPAQGEFCEGETGRARWEPDGKKVEIKWPKSGTSTFSRWPNDDWYAYVVDGVEKPGSEMPPPPPPKKKKKKDDKGDEEKGCKVAPVEEEEKK